jgi:diguanylate cyclase (GGDEF)-like protein
VTRSSRLQFALLIGLIALVASATLAYALGSSTAPARNIVWTVGAVVSLAATLAAWFAAGRVGRTLRAMNDHLARRERDLQQANEQLEVRVAEGTVELSRVGSELVDANRQVQDLAQRDALTGLASRRWAEQLLDEQLAQHRRHQRPFGALLCRIDHFDGIADQQDQAMGNLVLQTVALAILDTLRESDTAARFDGDRFLLLLPETDSDGLAMAAEKVRAAVAGLELEAAQPCTLSIGGAVTLVGRNRAEDLLRRAGAALDGAQAAGGNRVMIAGAVGVVAQPGWLQPTLPAGLNES